MQSCVSVYTGSLWLPGKVLFNRWHSTSSGWWSECFWMCCPVFEGLILPQKLESGDFLRHNTCHPAWHLLMSGHCSPLLYSWPSGCISTLGNGNVSYFLWRVVMTPGFCRALPSCPQWFLSDHPWWGRARHMKALLDVVMNRVTCITI